MAVKRIKRKLVWEETGVSEIIGTILMLSLTVVLFSSIITFVGRMPAPQESFNVEVDCYIEPINPANWSEGVNFNMVHQGGKPLEPMWIKIFITVNKTLVLNKDLNDGLQDTNGDDLMGVGEAWVCPIYNFDVIPMILSSNTSFSITIIHQEKNLLVWQENLDDGGNIYKPIIVRTWIDSDLGTPEVDDPGPISYLGDFKIYAEIIDPEGIGGSQGLDVSNLWVNLSSIYGEDYPGHLKQLNDTEDDRDAINDNIYVAICSAPDRDSAPVGYHYFHFIAYDHSELYPNYDEEFKLFPVGMIVGENPQIEVRGNPKPGEYEYIWFSDSEPINGDAVTIYATIRNLGGGSAEVDVNFYDGEVNESLKIGTYYMLLHAQGERDASVGWLASPGGNHTIIVTAEVNATYAEDKDIFDPYDKDDQNQTDITVMPKILLVDDDGHLNDKGDGDTVSFMRASLEAADFDYDFVAVGAGDGPGYDYGDYPLQDYDVVIWMAGYETEKVLTKGTEGTDDLANLQKYLEGNTTGGNGGSMWFITEGFWNEAAADGDLTNFAGIHLQIPNMPPSTWDDLPAELYGNETHPVTDYYADNPINTIERVAGTGTVFSWGDDQVPDKRMIALNNSAKRVYGITYDSDEYSGDPTTDSRILTQPWDFSRIEDTATQAQYTYKAIMWLGNITRKYTQDIAISEQTISPKTVFFKQNVTISFVVRNNGFSEYNYSNGDNLWYLLRITDIGGKDIVLPHLERIDYLGAGTDNTLTISYSWTPEQIGYHRVVIKIDPYNYIEESNELNNEISNFLASGEMFVQYRILVVDDDGSINNFGSNCDETLEITTSLEYLNSTGTYSYETYVVNDTASGPAFEPDMNGAGLSEYNAVIWVGGEVINPLTPDDMTNLTKYMEIGGNLWLIGNGLWTAADDIVEFDFEQNYLKVGTVTGDQDMATTLWGVEDDDISHGMEFDYNGDPNADIIVPAAGGIGFTYQDNFTTNYNSVRYHGNPITNTTIQYRAVTTPWLLSSLDSNDSKSEFTFMVLRWFDKPESRIEARITNMDIWLSDEHPQLGSGYVIQATVHNTGGSLGNVLVRFIDGETQIGSDSISVSPGETTTAEIIWVPLFAGQRTISILVDPINETDEIFEWSNNYATKNIYVYFFWDDMESGGAKWAHSSTVLLINGEEPLEYFYDTALDTNIITNWDATMSENLNTINDFGFYHTMDTAFWLQEPAGGVTTTRLPVDVVFALDTSGSMGFDPADMQNMLDAAKNFLGQLTADDRVAIYAFDGGGSEVAQPVEIEDYEWMTDANKGVFNASIDLLTANGYTCFYDTLGTAIAYSQANILPGRLEFVVGMTDGVSNSDDTYTPNANWGQIVPGDTEYSSDGIDPTQGLLYPPCMVYTIGLGITHDPLYPTAPDWSRTAPRELSGYGDEYDIWNSADSSPVPLHDAGGKYGENATTGEDNIGHYFYTTDSAQLPGIFQLIFSSISESQLEGENQTRSASPINEPMAVLWSDGFESDDFSNWDNSPTDWAIRDLWENDYAGQEVRAVAEGSRCANAYDSDGNWDSLEKSFGDISGYINRQVTFNYHVQDCENGEDIYVDIWHDGFWDTVVNLQDNNGDTQTNVGDWSLYTIDLENDITVTDWTDIRLGFDIDGSLDWVDEFLLDDVQLTGDLAIVAPWITTTVPVDGANNIPVIDDIVITFNEQINPTTFSYTCVPDPGGWTEVWSVVDTVVTLTHNNFAQSTSYDVTVTGADDMDGNPLVAGAVPNPWTFTTAGPPAITNTVPFDIEVGVFITQDIVITFSKPMNTGSLLYTCVPNPGGWGAPVWSGGDTIATLTHNNFIPLTGYTFTVTHAEDPLTNSLIAGAVPNPWSFTTSADNPPEILNTLPADGAIGVAVIQDIVITFTEPMNTGTVTYDLSPNPGITGEVWSVGDTILTLSHTTDFNQGTQYNVEVLAGDDLTGNSLILGAVPNPWSFLTFDNTHPEIILTTPSNGSSGVGLGQPILVRFSEAMNQATAEAAFSCDPDPGGWTIEWNALGTEMAVSHYDFNEITTYTCTVSSAAEDISGNSLNASATIPNPWAFMTGTSGGSGTGGTGGLSPDGPNSNKTAVTETMNLEDLDHAKLSFWHKYNMMPGANGGFLEIGYNVSGSWKWRYVIPASAYTGNLRASTVVNDSFDTRIFWCWNGISGQGTFDWEYVSVDLLNYVPSAYRDEVKVKFNYTQYGGGTGYGWYIDDVRVSVSRPDIAPTSTSQDVWDLTTDQAHSGTHSWANFDPDDPTMLKAGIDNYLMSTPIDLTNAKNAYLSAYLKFNMNEDSGAPPDGFRVEVSKDNGVTWISINLGVRTSWGISGTGDDADDGNASDGKTYTGLCDSGNYITDDYWVNMGTLSRVNIDLSSFSGNAIHVRFRMVTCSHDAYEHNNNHNEIVDPGFGGFYVDDVIVYGETILT